MDYYKGSQYNVRIRGETNDMRETGIFRDVTQLNWLVPVLVGFEKFFEDSQNSMENSKKVLI